MAESARLELSMNCVQKQDETEQDGKDRFKAYDFHFRSWNCCFSFIILLIEWFDTFNKQKLTLIYSIFFCTFFQKKVSCLLSFVFFVYFSIRHFFIILVLVKLSWNYERNMFLNNNNNKSIQSLFLLSNNMSV